MLVGTGGTEATILRLHAARQAAVPGEPLLLVTHPAHNSLPAALEALARLQQDGARGRIAHLGGPDDEPGLARLSEALADLRAFRRLHQSRIGLVGTPSDWLVASVPAAEAVRRTWGPEIAAVALEGVLEAVDTELGRAGRGPRGFLRRRSGIDSRARGRRRAPGGARVLGPGGPRGRRAPRRAGGPLLRPRDATRHVRLPGARGAQRPRHGGRVRGRPRERRGDALGQGAARRDQLDGQSRARRSRLRPRAPRSLHDPAGPSSPRSTCAPTSSRARASRSRAGCRPAR